MKKKKIEFSWGQTIKDCYNLLKEYKEKNNNYIYFGIFNTKEINSEMTLDEMYMLILGETKEEHDKRQAEFIRRQEEEQKKFELEKPKMIEDVKNRSIGFIPENKLKKWNSLVETNVNTGMYAYWIINNALEIIKLFKKNINFKDIKLEFYKQGHSGMTASITFSLLQEFCENSNELITYLNGEKWEE